MRELQGVLFHVETPGGQTGIGLASVEVCQLQRNAHRQGNVAAIVVSAHPLGNSQRVGAVVDGGAEAQIPNRLQRGGDRSSLYGAEPAEGLHGQEVPAVEFPGTHQSPFVAERIKAVGDAESVSGALDMNRTAFHYREAVWRSSRCGGIGGRPFASHTGNHRYQNLSITVAGK